MPRYSAGVRTAIGSTTLPIISLFGIASIQGRLRELGLFNTTTTEVALKMMRFTAAGTPGAGLTAAKHSPFGPGASCTPFTTHTVAPTNGDDLGYRDVLGAAIGAGVIWTFGDTGIETNTGTANGVGVLVASGTGQIVDAYMVWDE